MAITTDTVTTASTAASSNTFGVLRWLRPGWPMYAALAVLFGLYQGSNAFIGLRHMAGYAWWEPFTWEMSSIVVIVALIPLIARFENRIRIDSRPRARAFLAHILGAVAFSIVHTTGMVLLRIVIYALAGRLY